MNKISERAYEFVKRNKNLIINEFASLKKYQSNKYFEVAFMAGSPGAGKTEFSKNYLLKGLGKQFVRIDADEVRNILPGYSGKNSFLFQRACAKGVHILYDHIIKNKISAIVDGTFANYNTVHENVDKALRHGAKVFIIYIHQDPVVAWGFTKVREMEEGRLIPKKAFIEALLKAKENVDRIKKEFSDKVEIWFIEKDYSAKKTRNMQFDIDRIDDFIKIDYNTKTLNKLLKI